MQTDFKLYIEILFIGLIILTILYINSIFLYKQKLTDRITLMLLFSVIMSASEILWSLFDGHPDLRLFLYCIIYSYSISFLLFAAFLNRYLIERFGLHISKRLSMIIYGLPAVTGLLMTLTTPFTGLVAWVDENGVVHEGPVFDGLFYWIVLAYLFIPPIIALYFFTLGREKKPAGGEVTVSMIIFGIMAPVLYFLELATIGDEYSTLSLPVALALMYLITNESTHTALKTQAQIEAVESDLRIASRIQADALPDVAPEFADHMDLVLRGSMNTVKEVGGDFFDYFPIDDNRICFLIADVSGKGTPAALFMMTAKTVIKDYALTRGSTSEIFTEVNARLCENNKTGMFATAWIGILDTRTMTLQYTNAGHIYPILQRRGQPCEEMKKVHGLFLAGMKFTQYKEDELHLAPGDRLLLYTDGVNEAHDINNGLYGEDRLISIVDNTRDLPGEQVLERILADVSEFAVGVPQFDDITMVILTIKE